MRLALLPMDRLKERVASPVGAEYLAMTASGNRVDAGAELLDTKLTEAEPSLGTAPGSGLSGRTCTVSKPNVHSL